MFPLVSTLVSALLAQAEAAPPAALAPPTRVLVYHLEAPALDERQRGVLTAAVINEVRSLGGFTALGAGRARHQPILGDPERRDLCLLEPGCPQHAMDSVGAEALVHGRIESQGDGWRFTLVRLAADGTRLEAEQAVPLATADSGLRPGEELIAPIRSLVAQLFPEGVPRPAGAPTVAVVPADSIYSNTRLLPPWIFGVAAGLTVACTVAALAVGAEMSDAESRFNQLTTNSVVSGEELLALGNRAYDLADVTNALLWSTGGLLAASLALAFFTDFAPAVFMDVRVAPPAPGGAAPAGLSAALAGRW